MHKIETCNSINEDGETIDYFAFISSTNKNETEIFVKHFPTRKEAEDEAIWICGKLGYEIGSIEHATVDQSEAINPKEPF